MNTKHACLSVHRCSRRRLAPCRQARLPRRSPIQALPESVELAQMIARLVQSRPVATLRIPLRRVGTAEYKLCAVVKEYELSKVDSVLVAARLLGEVMPELRHEIQE
jgi:hypothetical protein